MPYIVISKVEISIDEYDENKIHIAVNYVTYGNKKDTLNVNIIVA